jgi:signal recognition particle GTPase
MEVFGSLVDVCAILQDRLLSLLNDSPPNRRIVIALAGVPGSGKSTIAATLLAHLDRIGICDAVVAPMVKSNHVHRLTQRLLTFTGWLPLSEGDLIHIYRS